MVVGSDGSSSGSSSSSSIIDGGRVGTGMKLWGRTKQVVVGTGNKPMKASCIGAASMTSGFGPSYQECLWLCRNAKS